MNVWRLHFWLGAISLAIFLGTAAVCIVLGLMFDHRVAGHPAVYVTALVALGGMLLWLVFATAFKILALRRSGKRTRRALEGGAHPYHLINGQDQRAKAATLVCFFAGLGLMFAMLFLAFAEGRVEYYVAAAICTVVGNALFVLFLRLISTYLHIRAVQKDFDLPTERELEKFPSFAALREVERDEQSLEWGELETPTTTSGSAWRSM